MNKQSKLVEMLEKNGLRPHHWDVLLSLEGRSNASFSKEGVLFGFLVDNGWVHENVLTQKSKDLLKKIEALFRAVAKSLPSDVLGEDYKERLKEYNEIFPKGKIPNGSPARTSATALVDKMVWAFENIEGLTWDKVYSVTKAYVDDFRTRNYEFMRTSGHFIKKEDKNRNVTSDLATYLESGIDSEERSTGIKFKVL